MGLHGVASVCCGILWLAWECIGLEEGASKEGVHEGLKGVHGCLKGVHGGLKGVQGGLK